MAMSNTSQPTEYATYEFELEIFHVTFYMSVVRSHQIGMSTLVQGATWRLFDSLLHKCQLVINDNHISLFFSLYNCL